MNGGENRLRVDKMASGQDGILSYNYVLCL